MENTKHNETHEITITGECGRFTPEDIAATIYHALGVNPDARIVDPLDRPQSMALGRPIHALFW